MRQSSGIAGLRRTLGQGIFGLDVSLTVGDVRLIPLARFESAAEGDVRFMPDGRIV